MKVLISVDMEGISGVVSMGHTGRTGKDQEYERFRRLMTAEANAAIEGAVAGGADTIVVNDSHGQMTNLVIEDLHPAARLITGSPKPLSMIQGIGPDVNAAMFVGYHALSGTGQSVITHTNTLFVLQLALNGRIVGEMGMNAAVIGHFGAPILMVTGDRKATEEARSLFGDVETVAVKEGITWSSADCLNPKAAQEQIRETAERAVRNQRGKPFVIPAPITARVTMLLPAHADMAELVPGARRIDGRTVEWTGDNMLEVHRAYRAMTGLANLFQMQQAR